MNYSEMYERAHENGQVKELTATYKEWKNSGDHVIGEYISHNKVQSRLQSGTYNQYLFKTDEGLVKFALGAVADAEVFPLMEPNRVYHIKYQGKERIAGGRQINRFKIEEIGFFGSPDGVEGEDQPPF